MMTSSRNYAQENADQLADELESLVSEWRKAGFFKRRQVEYAIANALAFRLGVVLRALRGGEGK